MTSPADMQRRLLGAVEACLQPLARILLACGVGYREFADLAKQAFVQEVIKRQTADGSNLNVSRISVSTGLSRKELARIRDAIRSSECSKFGPSNRGSYGARVMQLWHVDHRYLDELGRPLELVVEGDSATFTSLVRLAGGDVPVGAVKSELLCAGAIEELPDGRLAARKRHFIPGDTGEEILLGVSRILYPVLVGLERNTQFKKKPPFLQRIAYSQRLNAESAQLFRSVARNQAISFLDSVDDWLSAKETPPELSIDESAETFVVGVFYFEGPLPDSGACSERVGVG